MIDDAKLDRDALRAEVARLRADIDAIRYQAAIPQASPTLALRQIEQRAWKSLHETRAALAAPSGAQGETEADDSKTTCDLCGDAAGLFARIDYTRRFFARSAHIIEIKHACPDCFHRVEREMLRPTPSPAAEVTCELRGALDQIRQECATLRRRPQQGHVCDYRKAIDRFHDVAVAALRAMGKA
jgi:hypothetical protein